MISIIILISLCTNVYGVINGKNVTDFSNCKIEYTRSQASYLRFFEISEEHRLDNNLILDFHFGVLAPCDAHILLSPVNDVTRDTAVYEIVLGAGKNTFSEIRRRQKSDVKASVQTKNLLSPLDISAFWIHIYKNGLLEVGKEGEELAFLSYQDPNPLEITTFSFCTWPGVEAKWFYDCKREDGTNYQSKEIARPLSDVDKLKMFVFNQYDIYVRPVLNEEDFTIVKIKMEIDNIQLDEMKSIFAIRGTLVLNWMDDKVNWDPNDYGDIEKMNLRLYEIWTPNLIIYNSVDLGDNYASKHWLSINSEGVVTYKRLVKIQTWCDISGIGKWPSDEHVCDIHMGFMTQHNKLVLNVHDDKSIKFSNQHSNSQWVHTNITKGLFFLPVPWNIYDYENFDGTFVLKFGLRRVSEFCRNVYYTPLIAIAVSLLSTFLLSPFGPYKISLHCLQIIILSMVLVNLNTIIPAHPRAVPHLVKLYSSGILASVISLIFSVVVINWSRVEHTKPLPNIVHKLLSSDYIKMILYINIMKPSDDYNKLIDDAPSSIKDVQKLWIMMGVILDRILLFVYFIMIFVNWVMI